MPNKRFDPMRDVAARVVADNPDIKAEMQGLIMAMIKDAKHMMRTGTPSERQRLFNSVLPALLRSMQGADANANEAAEKEAWEQMKRDLLGGDG